VIPGHPGLAWAGGATNGVLTSVLFFGVGPTSGNGKLRINTFSFFYPLALAAFSQIKPNPYGSLFLYRALYSTSSKPPKGKSYDFFQKVYSDKSAINPFIIVDNFFKEFPTSDLAKANIDYKLINSILCNLKDFKLSKEEFDLLMKLAQSQPIKFEELPLSEEGKAYFKSMLGVTKRGQNSKAGVYLFINKITGESYIGSSLALASRIKDDYLRKGKILGKRPIELAIKKYGLSNFKLEVCVLSQELLINLELNSSLTPGGGLDDISHKSEEVDVLKLTSTTIEFKHKVRNLVLALEQIFILWVNPKYNELKVAGSVAGNKIKKELMEPVFEKTRKITYLYDADKKELVYQVKSRTLLAEAMEMKRRIAPKRLYLNRFFISDEPLSEKEYSNNLLSSKALIARMNESRALIEERVSKNFQGSENLSKFTELINTVTKERKVFPSLNATARYIRELNPEYKAAVGSPPRYRGGGGSLYKGIYLVRYLNQNEDREE